MYFTMKISPPKRAPCGVLPGRDLGEDVDFPKVMMAVFTHTDAFKLFQLVSYPRLITVSYSHCF